MANTSTIHHCRRGLLFSRLVPPTYCGTIACGQTGENSTDRGDINGASDEITSSGESLTGQNALFMAALAGAFIF